MDKNKFTSVHVTHVTKKSIDKLATITRFKVYDVVDIAIRRYLQEIENREKG